MKDPKEPKYTVHLPKTSFPMKADWPLREGGFVSRWEKDDIYGKSLKKNEPARAAKQFILHDGPPYANGHIHMGHALNKILKDIIVKYKSLQGFYSPYVPGWDCHGLPIEHQLMKEKGWDKRKIGRTAFRQEAARYAEHWIGVQKQEFKKLGILGDWDNPYKTMAPEYEAGIVKTFYDLHAAGFIYRDKKPVYWCASDETALAEAEVEYEEKTSPSIFVKFPVLEWPQTPEAQAFSKSAGKRVSVLVWTTTPWTLPANVALAFHPEATYKLWESPKSDEKFLVGEPGWKILEEVLGGGKPGATIPGLALEGLICQNPLNNNDSRGVLAEFVSMEEGTGIVHIAPGHGQDDYAVGKEYGLPILSPVDDRGAFVADVVPNALAGLKVWDANAVVIDLLAKSRRLLKEQKITHSYPHCWRCKNPIIFRATEQWFMRVDEKFRQKLHGAVDQVQWVPAYGKERINGMLKTRPDWGLARQRYWGTPIPMFFCESCKTVLSGDAVAKAVVDFIRKHGSTAWFEKSAADILPKDAACAKCGHKNFRKEEDILDVWFDSGTSWVSVLRERLGVASRSRVLYLEGSDQHRGWFQTSLLPAVALTGEPPYEEVLTHGFVVDGAGHKMAKSLGNVIAPQEILEKFGADIVRLWVAMSDYREDVRLSKDILDRVIDTYRKIRNTLRFLLGNLADFDPAKHAVPLDKLQDIDAAALASLNDLISQTEKHYNQYEFHLVSGGICDHFCINVLSGYYLDVQKDILYCDRADSPRRRSAQTAFFHIAQNLAKLLAPLLSFTAEETWQTLREQKLLGAQEPDSIFLSSFAKPVGPAAKQKSIRMDQWTALKTKINEAVEKSRQSGAVKGANDAAVTITLPASDFADTFKKLPPADQASLLGVSKITVNAAAGAAVQVMDVAKAPGHKCARCWIWREDVAAEGGLCARCAGAEAAVSVS